MNARTKPKPEPMALVGVVEDKPVQVFEAPAGTPTPATLLAMAVQQGADLDRLERLMALQERWEANEARKAYVESMVAFKASEDLQIGKNKHVRFETTRGVTEYDHAELSDCVAVILPALARHGISHAWTFHQDQTGCTVGCVLTHRLGHSSEPVTMTAAPDDSGGKNKIQSIASTKTYLERYTLLAATGLATGGTLGGESDDDDGRGYEPEPPFEDRDPREDRPESDAEKAARRRQQCVDAAARHRKAVDVIQDEIGKWDLTGADIHLEKVAEAWREIPELDQMALWLAPSKGGVLHTHERDVIKTKLPRMEAQE